MSQKTHNYLYRAGAAAVWLYLILRAGYVPPVHDEAATFFHYVNHREYWPGKALWDANNHILNSFLSWYFVKLFGVNTLALRMANLLFFPVYAWFLYKLSRELQSGWTRFLLLLSGLTVHGLVEYFGYARGYGMSMALLSGALYYGYRFFLEKNIRVLLPSLALFWLATASNLTLQNSVLLFIGLAAVYLLFEKFDGKTRLYGFLYLAAGIAALFPLIRLSFRMKEDGLLYYAAGEDFWTAVITSYTKQYFDSDLLAVKLFWFIWTGILLSGVFALLLRRGKWNTERKAAFFFPLLFLGNLTGIFAMHFLLDVNYPSDRTGMQLILFLLLACLFVADAGKPWQRALVTLPSLIFVVQFLAGANLSYSTYWKGEHLPERFWTRIHDESESGRYLKNPTLGGYRIRNLVWAWHNFLNGGGLQNMQYPEYCTGMEDYQVFSPGDYAAYRNRYDSLDTDEYSDVVLARRKTFVPTELYFDSTGISTPEGCTDEFKNLFETDAAEPFLNQTWLVEADVKLYSLATPPKIHVVTTLSDADGKTLDYQTSPLHWLKKEFRPEDSAVTVKIWWYRVPPETRRIVVYLWNVDRTAYTLQHASVRLLKARP